MPEKPDQPPEGAAIQRAMIRKRLSARQAATNAGMSEGRWRQIVSGYQSARGQHIPVTAPAATLAHMAKAVGLTPDDLAATGREDAADVLRDLAERQPTPPQDSPPTPAAASEDPILIQVLRRDDITEEQKRRIVEILLAEKARAERARAEHAEELIRFAQEST